MLVVCFCCVCELLFFYCLDSGKPAVDPAAAKLWTLSANDMEDDSVVSHAVVT